MKRVPLYEDGIAPDDQIMSQISRMLPKLKFLVWKSLMKPIPIQSDWELVHLSCHSVTRQEMTILMEKGLKSLCCDYTDFKDWNKLPATFIYLSLRYQPIDYGKLIQSPGFLTLKSLSGQMRGFPRMEAVHVNLIVLHVSLDNSRIILDIGMLRENLKKCPDLQVIVIKSYAGDHGVQPSVMLEMMTCLREVRDIYVYNGSWFLNNYRLDADHRLDEVTGQLLASCPHLRTITAGPFRFRRVNGAFVPDSRLDRTLFGKLEKRLFLL
jgi:hypothetical protein